MAVVAYMRKKMRSLRVKENRLSFYITSYAHKERRSFTAIHK